MFDELGVSFLPSADNGPRGGEGGPGGGRLEDVLRILSFRLPKVLGARAIAPADLLNSPGGDASPTGGGRQGGDPLADLIARSVLQNIPQAGIGGGGGAANPAGSFAPPVMPGGGGQPGPQAPPPSNYKPRIIPIEDPPAMAERGRPFNREMDDIEGQLFPGRKRMQA